jgi:hypothetical protein
MKRLLMTMALTCVLFVTASAGELPSVPLPPPTAPGNDAVNRRNVAGRDPDQWLCGDHVGRGPVWLGDRVRPVSFLARQLYKCVWIAARSALAYWRLPALL